MRPGYWTEDNARQFCGVIEHTSQSLFYGPVLTLLREMVDMSQVGKLLSVGSGNGRLDIPLMRHYPVRIDFVEPSVQMHSELMRNLAEHQGPGMQGQVFHGPFEEFETDIQYDLILAVHSFYYLMDPVKMIFRSLKMLSPIGDLAIVLRLSDSLGTRLSRELDKKKIRGDVSADSLAQNVGMPHELIEFCVTMPYRDYVEGSGLSKKGQDYVAFYAHRNWNDFSPSEKECAREIVDEYSDGNVIKEKFAFLRFRSKELGALQVPTIGP